MKCDTCIHRTCRGDMFPCSNCSVVNQEVKDRYIRDESIME